VGGCRLSGAGVLQAGSVNRTKARERKKQSYREDRMVEIERLAAIEGIKQVKACYWRGVDVCDGDMVRSVLAEDCELDYHGCCTDPQTGVDHLPAMNVTLRGRDKWMSDGMARLGIVSVHQGHQSEIEITSPDTAIGIWAFTDRMFFPAGGPFSRLTGYGFYHETYVKVGGCWLIRTTRITRIRVEVE